MPNQLRQIMALGRLRPFRNAYLGRGVAVWVFVRLALAWGKAPNPGVPTEIALLGVVGLAVWADARRRSEDLFLGNLGIPSWTIVVLAIPLAFILELVVP